MTDNSPQENNSQPSTPDSDNPVHRDRLAEIRRMLGLHGFYVSEADVWGDPSKPVIVRVEGCDEVLKDYALIREAVALGMHDPHTLLSLYASDLRERCRGRRRPGQPGGGESK